MRNARQAHGAETRGGTSRGFVGGCALAKRRSAQPAAALLSGRTGSPTPSYAARLHVKVPRHPECSPLASFRRSLEAAVPPALRCDWRQRCVTAEGTQRGTIQYLFAQAAAAGSSGGGGSGAADGEGQQQQKQETGQKRGREAAAAPGSGKRSSSGGGSILRFLQQRPSPATG